MAEAREKSQTKVLTEEPNQTSAAKENQAAIPEKQTIVTYRWILANVIVYISAHLYSALPTEGKVLDINWLQAAKELVEFNTWWKF